MAWLRKTVRMMPIVTLGVVGALLLRSVFFIEQTYLQIDEDSVLFRNGERTLSPKDVASEVKGALSELWPAPDKEGWGALLSAPRSRKARPFFVSLKSDPKIEIKWTGVAFDWDTTVSFLKEIFGVEYAVVGVSFNKEMLENCRQPFNGDSGNEADNDDNENQTDLNKIDFYRVKLRIKNRPVQLRCFSFDALNNNMGTEEDYVVNALRGASFESTAYESFDDYELARSLASAADREIALAILKEIDDFNYARAIYHAEDFYLEQAIDAAEKALGKRENAYAHKGDGFGVVSRIRHAPRRRALAEAKSLLGSIYFDLKRQSEALDLFEEAAKLAPEDEAIWLNWGLALTLDGLDRPSKSDDEPNGGLMAVDRFEEASKVFKDAEERFQRTAAVYAFSAWSGAFPCYLKSINCDGAFVAAFDKIEKALSLNAQDALALLLDSQIKLWAFECQSREGHCGLDNIGDESGMLTKARDSAEQAVRFSKARDDKYLALSQYGIVLKLLGDLTSISDGMSNSELEDALRPYEDAKEVFQEAIGLYRDDEVLPDGNALYRLAEVYSSETYRALVRQKLAAQETDGTSSDKEIDYIELDLLDSAIINYLKADVLSPDYFRISVGLGRAFFARALVRARILNKREDSGEKIDCYGEVVLFEDYAVSAMEFENAQQILDSEEINLLNIPLPDEEYNLAYRLGQSWYYAYSNFLNFVRSACASEPDQVGFIERIYGSADDIADKSERAFQEAAELAPQNSSPWFQLGDLLDLRADFATSTSAKQEFYYRAADSYRKAVDLKPNASTYWGYWSSAMRQVGDCTPVRAELERIRKTQSGSLTDKELSAIEKAIDKECSAVVPAGFSRAEAVRRFWGTFDQSESHEMYGKIIN